ncbi:MAG: ABC transporter ATP-binding protein [Thermoanaerobaculum sp.]|nr:ABC transporter ATP-binding protein [Thermoanaerobaculum sp.]MDW7968321.1 ABC transporter ATP-binding protein [Thermoanaerobaculum sp.]
MPTANGAAPLAVQACGIRRWLGVGASAREVLRGINLELAHGEFAALTGPSGSGKSTLLYILGGLDRPDAGTVSVGGFPFHGASEDELARLRNRLVGFVYQFHFLLPEFSALENVLMPLWARQAGRSRQDRQWAEELLARVGLYEKRHRIPRELSGGEQQRVAIARALVGRPQLVLADEPTGNLDSVNAQAVYDLFRQLHRELHQTILVVTHDPHWAAASDRVLELLDGTIVADHRRAGTTQSYGKG